MGRDPVDKIVSPALCKIVAYADSNGRLIVNGEEAARNNQGSVIKVENATLPCDCNGCASGKLFPVTSEPADADLENGQAEFYFESAGVNFQNQIWMKWKTTTGIVRTGRVV